MVCRCFIFLNFFYSPWMNMKNNDILRFETDEDLIFFAFTNLNETFFWMN